MTNELCVRVSVLEVQQEADKENTKYMYQKFNVIERRQREIFDILIKMKYTAYGAVGILVLSKFGLIDSLKLFILGA